MQGSLVDWLTMGGEWAIVCAILYEGHVALKEYRSARLFDAIKYVEDVDTRKARKIIYDNLQRSTPAKNWWEQDGELADAAATVCARYNLLGAVTREDAVLRNFVVREWVNNICTTYETLEEYMRYRELSKTGRAGLFLRYAELYDEARRLRTS